MFPEKLRALRIGRGLSLAGLAKELNELEAMKDLTKPNTGPQIGSWERGVNIPSYLEIKKLCLYFNVTPNFLIGEVNQTEDLNDLFISNKPLLFNGDELTVSERQEVYGMIKAYMRGRKLTKTEATKVGIDEDIVLPL